MGDLRQRLKTAVDATPVPPGLETRIRARVAAGPRSAWFRPGVLIPAGALAAACALLVSFHYTGRLPVDLTEQAAYIEQVSEGVPRILRVGLGDHIHCAVFRKYPKQVVTPAQFVESIGPKHADLVRILERNTPPGYRMLLAHQCHYLGRGFVHLVVGDGQHLLSLSITPKEDGEARLPIHEGEAARFRVSAMETDSFLVYVVSDLPGNTSSALMNAMAPELKAALGRI